MVEIIDISCGCLSWQGRVQAEVPGEKRIGTRLAVAGDGLINERGDGSGRLGKVGKNRIL